MEKENIQAAPFTLRAVLTQGPPRYALDLFS